jgi:hypothetical protein
VHFLVELVVEIVGELALSGGWKSRVRQPDRARPPTIDQQIDELVKAKRGRIHRNDPK